jgi:hypothetical protein
MRIRGYGFELGESLSKEAAVNLKLATDEVRVWLAYLPPPLSRTKQLNSF